MEYKDLLIFDVSSEYGHFRKFNTTTSPLTYSIPTRISIAGMLGAVLGIERETGPGEFPEGVVPVQEIFKKGDSEIAIQVLSPINKVTLGFNLINTKVSFFEIKNGSRTQIPFELLKNPSFRVFFHHNDTNLMDELAKRLMERSYYFNPYLGLSQFTADLKWLKRTKGKSINPQNQEEITEIISAINLSSLKSKNPIQFDRERKYIVETVPISMDRNRIVKEYGEVIIESQISSISAKVKSWYEVPEFGNIYFL